MFYFIFYFRQSTVPNYLHYIDVNGERFQFLQFQCCFQNDLDDDIKKAFDVISNYYRPSTILEVRTMKIALKDVLEH